jgi:hypothetical protein
MEWQQLVVDFEASLALLLILSLLVRPVRTVRRFVVWLVLPTIVMPIYFALSTKGIDYRLLWLGFRVFEWICRIGVVYVFLSLAFSRLRGMFILFRRIWTLALALVVGAAALQNPFPLISLDSLISDALTFERIISVLLVFAFLSLLAFVLWYPVWFSKDLAIVSLGAALVLSVQFMAAIFPNKLSAADARMFYGIQNILWIACLAYWILFLSRNGEGNGVEPVSGA